MPARPAIFAVMMLGVATLALGDDLFDPAEARRYRRTPGPMTDRLIDAASSQPDQPAGGPAASQPDLPFATGRPARPDALPGYIELSDGRVLPGAIYTTRERPFSVFDQQARSYRRIPPAVVRGIDAEIVWQRDEPEWRWKDGGSDEKIYTGKTYPARMLRYTFTLANGEKLSGTVQQPIYVQPADGEPVQLVLHERQKGPVGSQLPQLVYVRHVSFGADALARGQALARKSAASQPATATDISPP